MLSRLSTALGLHQGAIISYMEYRPLPSLCDLTDFSQVGILCTFSNITAAAAAGIARSSQLSSFLAGQAVQYIMAGGPVRHGRRYGPPITVRIIDPPPHPSPPAGQGRTPCWVNSLRPSASVDLNRGRRG